MGGSKGQSTVTVEKWPAFLEDTANPYSVPGILNLYLDASREVSDYYESVFLGGVSVFTNFAKIIVAQAVEEAEGIAKLNTRGRNGNTTVTKAKALVTDVIGGDYLDGSRSEFQEVLTDINQKSDDAFEDDIRSKVGGSLYLMGDPAPDNLAEELTSGTSQKYRDRLVDRAYADNYGVERRHQHDTLYPGKDYAIQDVYDAEAVRRAGIYQREYEQTKLDDAYRAQMEYTANRIRAEEVFGNALRSMVGAQQAHTTPYYKPNPAGSILGGALVGAQAGSVLGPWGAAGGAVIGGILGYAGSQ
ncbi:hypothetical protein [Candidatus Manganitrophus noduliformans]|uniref:Glycine zipper domain-containing protein n=1 Tax=Candidatus Manganitrophus noduliformans TaxID=2606439 RepID=A0A7X6DMM5_9BACT|nr:hypothetical protein [Candidatus Manganitrophus noduliformans]NKE69907.1 hypothetical protein [Candidatus Manganitrophus noduliformans]